MNIEQTVSTLSPNTIPVKQRAELLKKLHDEILHNEKEICTALYQDLGKCEFEAIATETSIVLADLVLFRKKLKRWTS